MPTYEYLCNNCGNRFDVFQRFSESPLEICDVCGGALRKVYHPAGIVLRGSGFYRNDSRKSGVGASGSSSSSSSSSSEGSSSNGGSSSGSGSKKDSKGSDSGSSTGSSSSGAKKDSGSSVSSGSGS